MVGDETFTVTLTSPVGASAGAVVKTTITITDIDQGSLCHNAWDGGYSDVPSMTTITPTMTTDAPATDSEASWKRVNIN